MIKGFKILLFVLTALSQSYSFAIKPTLHEDSWKVESNSVDKDNKPYKGQQRDLKDWSVINPYDWFDLAKWKQDRKIRDNNPDWKIRNRDLNFKEQVGRVIKCIGVCRLFRSLHNVSLSSRSTLKEGDEVYTEEDSYLWVFLIDGSLVRLAPKTSISFNEINLGQKKIRFLARLNAGHIIWKTRLDGEYEKVNLPETDTAFYPLYQLKANREFFAIREFRNLDTAERMQYSASLNAGFHSQYLTLNNLIKDNSKKIKKRDSEVFLYSPNMTILGKNGNYEASYTVQSKSYFRFYKDDEGFTKTDKREQSATFLYRGYNNTKEKKLESETLYEVSPNGLEITDTLDYPLPFEVIKSQVKRIPSLHVLRELWLLKFSKFLYDEFKPSVLASEYAYRLWGHEKKDEFELRRKFLIEYIRRVETTNLVSIKKVFKNDKIEFLDKSYYSRAMLLHYNYIKKMYRPEYKIVREMSDAQYYLWTVRNAKK